MTAKKISTEEFLQLARKHPVLDVRSPGEYGHAHIPGAHTFPLFSDEERKVVGTLYKQESREKAIKKGLEYFGARMVKMLEDAEAIVNDDSKSVMVYCWRGGMRSAGVAWLLDLYGFKVYTLAGGYKSFRQWVLVQFNKEYPIKIIGGYTGSGKTEVLAAMQQQGLTTIDLEALAHHKGSAFGAINMPQQPSQEMFENKLATTLFDKHKKAGDEVVNQVSNTIYLEDESQRIGLVNIPVSLWKQMRSKPLLFLQIPFEERLSFITEHYGKGEKDQLISAIVRIKKRLGGLETKTAINHLLEDNTTEAFRVLLYYYDKHYKKGLQNREGWEALCTEIPHHTVEAAPIARKIFLHESTPINV